MCTVYMLHTGHIKVSTDLPVDLPSCQGNTTAATIGPDSPTIVVGQIVHTCIGTKYMRACTQSGSPMRG